MNPGLRQRVVGALVLVALAVVFLPMLLDLGGSYEVDTTRRIPRAPEIKPVQIAQPKPPADLIPAQVEKPIFALEGKEEDVSEGSAQLEGRKAAQQPPTRLAADEPRLTEHGLPEAWVIQVGSFKDKSNAEELRERLIKVNYKAFVRANDVDGVKSYRVFVGPKGLKNKLLADQQAIDKQFGIKSWLVKFEP